MFEAKEEPFDPMSVELLSGFDLHLLREGTHYRMYEKLGAHIVHGPEGPGVHFAVWAPHARAVSVIGEFNHWEEHAHPMGALGDSGVWRTFVPGAHSGQLYKFRISTPDGRAFDKADPVAFASEPAYGTASKIWDLSAYEWGDGDWMSSRGAAGAPDAPVSIYEVHAGSWRRVPEQANRWLSYREMAPLLAEYVSAMGFTHVEFMPLTEHPHDASWGYQPTSYFAPTSRFGTPGDFKLLVDTLHQRGIGVILDWAPAHFPGDAHGLASFDGAPLYERGGDGGVHPDWGTLRFDFSRHWVWAFLISSALFWLEKYHIDGLRVDGVASILHRDHRDRAGWSPSPLGGNEDIHGIEFLRELNEVVHREYPQAVTIAEESSAWPQVSRPTCDEGLGFGMKWNMGWTHDLLDYLSKDPAYRSGYHHHLTFSLVYAFHENFVLPVSHDDVAEGRGSLPAKMPGDAWQRLANVRLLFGHLFGHPGKKLLFMGCEFGQWSDWHFDTSLDWHLLAEPAHSGLQRWVRDLNTFYRAEPALHQLDFEAPGFEWVDCHDHANSVISYLRRGRDPEDVVLFICNFTPVPRTGYRFGVPAEGFWAEILNSDSELFGGSNLGNAGGVASEPVACHGRANSIRVTLPPLAVVAFRRRVVQPEMRESGE